MVVMFIYSTHSDWNVGHTQQESKRCLSPWWGSNPACIPKFWGHTGRAPCGLHVKECHSQRTTRQSTARWSARSGWTGGKRTGRCRWVLGREGIRGVSSRFGAATYCRQVHYIYKPPFGCGITNAKHAVCVITGKSWVWLEFALLWIMYLLCISSL